MDKASLVFDDTREAGVREKLDETRRAKEECEKKVGQLTKQLQIRGIHIGRKKVRRYMTEMAIDAIYPKENLSKRAHGAKIYPYLLRNAVIDRPNQAWSIDITYIRLEHGLMATTCR